MKSKDIDWLLLNPKDYNDNNVARRLATLWRLV